MKNLRVEMCRNSPYSRGENGPFHDDDDVYDDPVVIGSHGNKKKTSRTKVNWKTNGGESRDLNTLVEVQLNKVSRPSVRPPARPSVRPPARPSIRPSVHVLDNKKTVRGRFVDLCCVSTI